MEEKEDIYYVEILNNKRFKGVYVNEKVRLENEIVDEDVSSIKTEVDNIINDISNLNIDNELKRYLLKSELRIFRLKKECMFACSLLQTAIENCDSFNVRFVTTEYILMASHLSYLRYMWFERSNIKMFVKCNDNNGIKKLSELDKATGIKQHIISMIDSNNSLVEYCYYIIFGNKMATQNISTVLSRLEPGLLYDHIFDFEKDYEFINDDINSLMFDAVTSKYDFITAVTFADYDNLFNNKHTYFTNSQFSGEVHSDSFSSLDCADEVLKNVIINDYYAGFRGLVTDIKKPIRPNHFNIKKFIEDKNIDKSSDIFVNVTFILKDKDIVTREYIHSIEYITLDGEKCVYKF